MESGTQASKISFFRLCMRHLEPFQVPRTGYLLAFVFLAAGVFSLSAIAPNCWAIDFEFGRSQLSTILTARQEQTPAQQETPPAQQETPPAQQETPPAQQETPPTQQETPPAQQETPPAQQETPPAQQETPPAQQETPPTQQETPPAQQETPPAQQETPPAQQETPPSAQAQSPPQQESAANAQDDSTASAPAAMLVPAEEAANTAESSGSPAVASPEELQFQEVVLGKVEPTLQDLRQLQQRVNSLVSQLRPAVVGIRMGGGQGSGVLVSGDGFVLTAAHVVGRRGQRAEIVMPDGSTHSAIVLGTDAASDSGMLRMVEKGPWPYVEIGESESLKRGQWLLALGHPGGFDPERSSVVRVGRLLADPGRTTLQTDCTLVGGDSGGPLFDLEGRVVGIHSRISRRIQQNYHVSVDIYTSEWDEMSKDPTPTLGFRIKSAEVTDQLLIDRVTGDGPAAKAGLKSDDRILRFDGEEVKNRDELRAKMAQLQNEQKIKIVVLRDNAEVEVELQVELK